MPGIQDKPEYICPRCRRYDYNIDKRGSLTCTYCGLTVMSPVAEVDKRIDNASVVYLRDITGIYQKLNDVVIANGALIKELQVNVADNNKLITDMKVELDKVKSDIKVIFDNLKIKK